jgi:hypothetical protein
VSGHSLESLASFVRDLNSACSALLIEGNNLLAGSHEGLLKCWDSASGDLRWSVEVAGPISSLSIDNDRIYTTASASLHAIDMISGKLLWSRELEGGSDYVKASKGSVWATSSVYELEVADFIEATIWRFNEDGDKLERWIIAERPWCFDLHKDGGVLLGLGRPRCGYLMIQPGEKPIHHQLETESPVTCGCRSSEDCFLLGHADGSISSIGSDILSDSGSNSLVTDIYNLGSEWISGHDDGSIRMNENQHRILGSIDSVSVLDKDGWASSWNGSETQITILGDTTNTIPHNARVRQMHSSDVRLVVGDEQGRLFLLEAEIVERRLSESGDSNEISDQNSEIRARLRMLRNR